MVGGDYEYFLVIAPTEFELFNYLFIKPFKSIKIDLDSILTYLLIPKYKFKFKSTNHKYIATTYNSPTSKAINLIKFILMHQSR
jgi:hypothetical protein